MSEPKDKMLFIVDEAVGCDVEIDRDELKRAFEGYWSKRVLVSPLFEPIPFYKIKPECDEPFVRYEGEGPV